MTEFMMSEASIGEVQLTVEDLDRAAGFYEKGLGFQLLQRQGGQAVLGAGNRRLVVLNELPGAQPARGTTGLYHFAVLLPDRKSLARLLYHLAETKLGVQGLADHGVSEALYLADPDGNGIELYRDRHKSEWPLDDLGRLQMGTDELDVDDLVMELKGGLEPFQGLPQKTTIGHVHLRVRDLAEAEQFYHGLLGFQVMQRYGSGAVFLSAGGYHHHVGMNTWQSAGAPPPPVGAAGLRWFEVRLPDAVALEVLKARLASVGAAFEDQEGGLLLRDPSQNGIMLRS